jgi:pimeloyl-ACP methyl ester carboxylesterase
MNTQTQATIDAATFHADVHYIESLWQRKAIGNVDMPVIDIGTGEPLVFVPILEHLEFVYARQIRELSKFRRVILYRRQETRTSRRITLPERTEELSRVLDALGIQRTDFVAHGDGAMVLFEFAARYPQRCRSLVIIAQGADYQIAPHPFIWLLHELYMRLPVEYVLPASFLRRTVVNYIVASKPAGTSRGVGLSKELIEEQFAKIQNWPFVYKFSVLPVIHYYDMRERLDALTMPILLINRADDALSPEAKTRWLASHLPNSAGYSVIPGSERLFMYAESERVNGIIKQFLGIS